MSPSPSEPQRKRMKLAFFVSHPIQYQAPLLRRLTQEADLDVTAIFFSDRSLRGYWDEGFKKNVEWDIPLLGGYRSEFLPQMLKEKPRGWSFFHPLNKHIFRSIRQNQFDVVWTHGYATLNALLVMIAAKFHGAKVLLSADSNADIDRSSGIKKILKSAYMSFVRQFVDGVLVIGEVNRAYWRCYFGERVEYIPFPYAVDNASFRERIAGARERRPEILHQLGLEENRTIFLFASKLQRRKKCIDLVMAYKRLLEKIDPGQVPYLLIAGDGEERPAIEKYIAEEGLQNVRLLGFKNQSELPALFSICDAFVLPSESEPWGLIVNEVMNAGCAVVVTDEVGCQQDLVHPGVNGYVYSAGDVDALAGILLQLVKDPEKRMQMGKASLQMIDTCSYEQDVAGLQGYMNGLREGKPASSMK